jgi:hypothetical protein
VVPEAYRTIDAGSVYMINMSPAGQVIDPPMPEVVLHLVLGTPLPTIGIPSAPCRLHGGQWRADRDPGRSGFSRSADHASADRPVVSPLHGMGAGGSTFPPTTTIQTELSALQRAYLLVFMKSIDGTTSSIRSEGDNFRDSLRLQRTCPPPATMTTMMSSRRSAR